MINKFNIHEKNLKSLNFLLKQWNFCWASGFIRKNDFN